jgi:hypothetical protein
VECSLIGGAIESGEMSYSCLPARRHEEGKHALTLAVSSVSDDGNFVFIVLHHCVCMCVCGVGPAGSIGARRPEPFPGKG